MGKPCTENGGTKALKSFQSFRCSSVVNELSYQFGGCKLLITVCVFDICFGSQSIGGVTQKARLPSSTVHGP